MTGRLLVLSDLTEGEREIVRDRPLPPQSEPAHRDERSQTMTFLRRDHETTDRIRALHDLAPLYDERPDDGACCPWEPARSIADRGSLALSTGGAA